MNKFNKIIENFSRVNVLIVGDVMLDRYFYGKVTRISPEAPVPVVNVSETSATVGGAANVALNVAGLGARPVLVGLVGRDQEGEILSKELENRGVCSKNLITVTNRQTTVKTRIVAHQQHIVRLDQENTNPVGEILETEIWDKIDGRLTAAHVIIVSDYAKGMLTPGLLAKMIAAARKNKIKILVDPKGKNYKIYKDASILTPNRREAAEACNFDENMEKMVETAGQILMDELGLEALLITQGEHGISLFQKEIKQKDFPAVSRDVFDVTGAGDTVIATLGVATGAGASLENAAELANIAAGIVVEHFGTTAIEKEELLAAVRHEIKNPGKGNLEPQKNSNF